MLIAAPTARHLPTPDGIARVADKRSFVTHDGTALFYRHWPVARGLQRQAIVLLHREHEHSGRVQHLVEELALDDCAFFAWDARGHGCSPGARGNAPGVSCLGKDLDAFVRHIGERHGAAHEAIHVIACGASGILASAWVLDYSPRIASLVLAAAAFECRGLAALAPRILRALRHRRGNLLLRTYARAEDLTHDPARRAAYRVDPLIGTHTSAELLASLQETSRRILACAAHIDVPTQILIAGDDRLVRAHPQQSFFEALGTADKEVHLFEGMAHDLLGESNRERVLAEVRRFVRQHAASAAQAEARWENTAPVIVRQSQRPAGRAPLDRLRMSAARASLRAAGRLSEGLRLAMKAGIEAPAVIEYIDRNRVESATSLGRALDRRFLDSVPARCLRVRSAHLRLAIARAAERLQATRLPLRIVDLSAATGMHVIDTIQALPRLPDSVLLLCEDAAALARGQALLRERRLEHLASFRHIERLTGERIGLLAPSTTIAIAALHAGGMRGQIPIAEVLCGLSRALPAGGSLIYTSGPHDSHWHRHAEAISEGLVPGMPNDRTVRSQAGLDRCIEAAGFRPTDRWVDEWGIFSVSLVTRSGTEAAIERLVSR